MANATNSELSECYMFLGQKYGSCAADPDAEIPDELQDRLVMAGVLDESGEEVEAPQEIEEVPLMEGFNDIEVANLKAAGYDDPELVAAATVDDLKKVEGIGQAKAQTLKQRADGLVGE